MSLTLALSALDLSILPVVIHGLFILILLRRLFSNKKLPICFFTKFNVEFDERFSIQSKKSSRDYNCVDISMDSKSDCDKKVQETEANEVEVDSRKRQSLRKNSAFGSSASVQAKMSLDLIVEQLKREMSLKDIEAESKDDARIKAQDDRKVDCAAEKDSTECEYSYLCENEVNVKSEKELEEEALEDTEKSLKEISGCATKTANLSVKDISQNFEKNVEESEIKDLHQREATNSSREPVVNVYGMEEKNLYGLIRSMIAAEVRRYEERERTMVRKVHSDTTDVVGRRTKRRKLSLLNNKDSQEIEKKESEDMNPIKMFKGLELEERNSPVDSIKSKLTVNHFLGKENDANVGASVAFVLERKHDLGKSFGCRVEGRRINEGEKVSSNEEKDVSTNQETQTEREYTIRTVRSCPVRRKRRRGTKGVLFDAQHEWIYRKASDNLIYEKGKASGSPSYVPLTQRFRWKYIQPTKAR